ncbi:hypothetical protein [Kribbella sp. VKM Ac-2571]|uniref:hypothetical protein n=1 Tax=Kribbella sp. VKM Ac-2571 TaxID=2512222 RepID=UPI0014150571
MRGQLAVRTRAGVPADVAARLTGKLGTTTRDGGARQFTVAGHPLYTFVGDSTPGQTNGQGINLNGGVWTAVSPGGAPVTAPNPAGSSTQKSPSSGY